MSIENLGDSTRPITHSNSRLASSNCGSTGNP